MTDKQKKRQTAKMTVCFILLFFMAVATEAQVTVTGIVVNDKGETVPDVYVISDTSHPVVTRKDGVFELNCPADSGSIVVNFSCTGYKSKKIKLYKGEKDIQVLLLDSVLNMNEVIIRAPKYGRFSNYAAQIVKLNTLEIYTNPHALGDILGSLQIMPGVQRNGNDGRLIIQGGATDETQTYVDGLLLFNQYNLEQKNVSVRSRFSPDLFNGVTLQSSGYGAQFGNAMSGIVRLNTISNEDMEEKIDINASSVSLESSVIHKTNTVSLRGNLSYMNLAPYGKTVKDRYGWHKFFNRFSSDIFMINSIKSGIEIKTHLTYNKSGVDYSYSNADDRLLRNNLKEDNFLSSIVADIPLSSQASLYAGANFAYNNFSGTDVAVVTDSVNDVKINSHQKLALLYRNERITNSLGIENVHSQLKESYRTDALYKLNFINNQLAVYDEFSFLYNKFNANLGLRGEYSTLLKKYALSPRLYMAYSISPENILSLSMGKYFQLPNEKYLKFTGTMGYNEAYSATVSYSYVKRLSKLQLDVFRKKYTHLTTFDLNQSCYSNAGKGEAKGINVFWKGNLKNMEYWLSYGYLDADILSDNFTKHRTPSYVSNHTFNATLKYWLKGIKTMIGSSFFIDAGTTSYKKDNPEVSKRTPHRSRMDLSLSYVPAPYLIIHFSCQNILGRNNVYGYEYSSVGDAYREITNPATRFYYIGVFLTISKLKTNQLKSL
jgi:hypothetical protein